MSGHATLVTVQRICTGFVYAITNGWTHLKRVAPEYTVQYETPTWVQRGASVTTGHWSGTVRLRSERHID